MAGGLFSARPLVGWCCVLALAGACGGRAIDTSGDGDGDGDRYGDGDGPGPGVGDGDVVVPGTGGGGPMVEIPDCTVDESRPGVKARYERLTAANAGRETTDFFAFPWPEISRPVTELTGFPNPASADGCTPSVTGDFATLLMDAISPRSYRDYLIGLSAGYLEHGARHPVIYVSFDGAISPAIPTAIQTLSAESPVFLVNVDWNSPEQGQLVPIRTRIFQSSRYLPPHTLAAAPVPGFPLQSDTRYALVIKRTLGDAAGNLLGASAEFEARKVDDCAEPYTDYLDAFTVVEKIHNVNRSDIAALVLFQTGSPTNFHRQYVDGASGGFEFEDDPAVNVSGPATDLSSTEGYHRAQGIIHTPIMQLGEPPYLPPLDGVLSGDEIPFEFDPSGSLLFPEFPETIGGGDPNAPRTEPVDFVLTLPSHLLGGAVVGNVPLVVYGPGTGGSFESAVNEGIARALAQIGYATLTATPVMHGPRAHSENIDPVLRAQLAQFDALLMTNYEQTLVDTVESGELFFNPLNLQAARGNVVQAAIDYSWQLSVLAQSGVEVSIDGQLTTITFDPDGIFFFGHSQGAGIGPLLGTVPDLDGAVLSGASGHIPSTILHKTKPADTIGIAQMIDYLVCDASSEPLDELHPVMSLIGHWFEPVDAELAAPDFISENLNDLFVVVGRDDAYAPPESNHAITAAALLHQVASPAAAGVGALESQDLLAQLYPGQGYGAQPTVPPGNLGGTTGIFRVYHDDSCADDHFVYLCSDEAMNDWLGFFESALVGAPGLP